MRMEKNKRSTLRKKIVGILCIAAMTASLATGMAMSVMAVPEQAATPEIVTEAVSLPQYASTSVMDEANAIQITLGADLIENNRISLNLDQDGATYVISGSNYINDAYVDTTITVPGRTTVHVIFDGVDIKNDDGEIGCGGSYGTVDLLDIRGTMNVYTKADSTLAFRTCSFTGAMNFNSYGEQSGKLTLTNVDGEAISFNEDINGPLFNMFGGNVAFDVGSHNNLPFYTKYNMSGGTLYLKAFYLPTNFVLTGGTLINDVMFDWGGPARNAAGQELHNYTVTLPDITAPTAITQMGGSAWSGLYTDETGEVTLWTPETFTTNDEVYYFYTADTCYKLFMENSEIVVEKLDAAVHTVTFNMPDGSTRLIQIYDGGNVELPAVPEGCTVAYSTEDGEFDGQNITKDYTVNVQQFCPIVIDGVVQEPVLYGTVFTLPDGQGYADQNGKVYTERLVIQEPMTLYTVKAAVKENESYVAIENQEDIRAYNALLDKGVSANALLLNDVTMPSDLIIGNGNNAYTATFDGNGYIMTVAYTDESANAAAPFGVLGSSGVIRNLHVDGEVIAVTNAGGIALSANNNARIENCTSSVNVKLLGNSTQSGSSIIAVQAGGFVGGSDTGVYFTNCLFDGTVTHASVENSLAYLAGFSGYATNGSNFTNCLMLGTVQGNEGDETSAFYGRGRTSTLEAYYDSSLTFTREQGNGLTEEQLSGGEAAYRLGEAWGQVLGQESRPRVGGSRVYQINVYADCKADTVPTTAYSNTNADIRPAHQYQDDKCSVCGNFEDGIGAQLLGNSLTIDNSAIRLNVYMGLDESVQNPEETYMQLTTPDGKVEKQYLRDATLNTDGSYTFYCMVPAQYIHEKYTVQIFAAKGECKIYHCSVEEYLNTILENKDNNAEYAAAADLVQALSNYGTYAKAYFDPDADPIPMTEEMEQLSIPDCRPNTLNDLPEGISYYGFSLVLNSQVTMRHYFVVEDPALAEQYNMKLRSGKYYMIEVDYSMSELRTDKLIRVGDWSITCMPLSYVQAACEQSKDEKLIALVKSLYLYDNEVYTYNLNKGGE